MFNLGQICQSSEANLPSSTCSLFSDKARCFSQSECALYGNFIIKYNTMLTEFVGVLDNPLHLSFSLSAIFASTTLSHWTLIMALAGCFMTITDIQFAFRIIPVHPDDWKLLAMSWKGFFLFLTKLSPLALEAPPTSSINSPMP